MAAGITHQIATRYLMRVIISLLSGISFLYSLQVDLKGELSAILTSEPGDQQLEFADFRLQYIPTFEGQLLNSGENFFDLEIAGSFSWIRPGSTGSGADFRFSEEPYRLWVRYSTRRFETRLGLQKITFGPGRLFRSLMWFDRLDPTDPQQLTEGVYGVRMQYYFRRNANLWAWCLYGNDRASGWDLIASKKKIPEWGGRWQFAVPRGEMAMTFHRRVISQIRDIQDDKIIYTGKSIPEYKIGWDGSWDIGPGLWFEGALVYGQHSGVYPDWQSFFTVGMDYTFAVGNGLTLAAEQFNINSGETLKNASKLGSFSGLIATYPLTLFDQVAWYMIYDWEQQQSFQYVRWQRSYNSWLINLAWFWSSGDKTVFENPALLTTGTSGFQLIIIFNH